MKTIFTVAFLASQIVQAAAPTGNDIVTKMKDY